MERHHRIRHGFIRHGFIRHGFIRHGFIRHGFIRHGFIRHGFVRHRFGHTVKDHAVKGPVSTDRLHKALVGVSVATVASGGMQMVAPGFVLGQLDASDSATDRQLFGTIGMFMAVVGGLLLQDLVRHDDDPTVLLWAAIQKLAAAAAVAIGVRRKVFAGRALAVASFDGLSGIGCLAYRRRVLQRTGRR